MQWTVHSSSKWGLFFFIHLNIAVQHDFCRQGSKFSPTVVFLENQYEDSKCIQTNRECVINEKRLKSPLQWDAQKSDNNATVGGWLCPSLNLSRSEEFPGVLQIDSYNF